MVLSPMRPLAQRLLADRTFDIEFQGYLTNHVKHAIIALERLQAPESRVQEYWDTYTTLTPYNLPLHRVEKNWQHVEPATLDHWKSWRGQKVNWQEQAAFISKELEARDGDTNRLVKDFAPEIIDGMVGSLTHTIIHLGWAIDADSPWMIVEGLAYLNFAHVGVNESLLKWNAMEESSPMESFVRISDTWHTQNLGVSWIARVKAFYDKTFHPELVPAGLQWEIAKVIQQPHAVATHLPSWISTSSMDDIWEALYRATVYLFLATRDDKGHGNFLVLHLMTSLWGLEKTLEVIDNENISRKAIGHYYANVVCVLSAASSGFPDKARLVTIQDEYPRNTVDPRDFDWTEMVQNGIAEEEEHNIKLVYVMKELWNRYGYWTGFREAAKSFTLTPNIGPTKTEFTQ